MKQFFSFIASVFFALTAWGQTSFTFTSADDVIQEKDGIIVMLDKGTGSNDPRYQTDYETGNPEMRLYTGNTITVSSETAMTTIQMVFAKSSASNKAYAGLSTSVEKLVSGGDSESKTDWKIDSWTGNAAEVVFTLTGSGQRQIRQLVVNGEAVIDIPEEQPLPTEADLDWSYYYFEPEVVHVPDTQFFHKEYAFIDGNILVHCSQGSIMRATTDEAAYFGCMAGDSLTFTATNIIKGIAIKGNVRKQFSASCSSGNIYYLSDPDLEKAGDPVLVVREVNDFNVTIHCDKNLSCYEVKVYFESNPDPVGDAIEGETFFLNYDTAQLDFDAEESEKNKYVYSLYIWDKTNEYIYLTLDINTKVKDVITGEYSIEAGNMTTESFFQYGEDYADYSYATEGQMVINEENGVYTISGYITCENLNTYNFSYSGRLMGDEEMGIEDVQSDKAQRTKILRGSRIIIVREGRTYDVQGREMKD